MKIIFLLPLFTCLNTLAQERQDDPLPVAKVISSMNSFVGWTKSDIGKWHSAVNAMPTFEEDLIDRSPVCENVLKFELARVNFNERNYYCIVKYSRQKIETKYGVSFLYDVKYWLTDSIIESVDSLNDAVIDYILVSYYQGNIYLASKPVQWASIVKDIKKNYTIDDSNQKLLLRFRKLQSQNKVQFLFADYDIGLEGNLMLSLNCGWMDDDKTLNARYYEIEGRPFNLFISHFQKRY